MKKILILVSLVALVASGLFAQVTLNGKVEYGVQQGLDAKTPFISDPDTRIEGNIKADDANSGYFRLRLNDSQVGHFTGFNATTLVATTSTARLAYFDRAYFTTDYLKAFGLSMDDLVKISGQYGLNEYNVASVADVTSYDTTERFASEATFWGTAQTVEILKMIKLTVASSFPDYAYTNGSTFFVDGVATIPGVGPGTLQAEAAYVILGVQPKDASVNFEANYAMTGLVTGLTLTPAVGYSVTLAEKTNDPLVGAVKVAYDTDMFGVSLDGGVYMTIDQDSDVKTNDYVWVPIAFGANYSKLVGVDLGIFLDVSAEDSRGLTTDGKKQGTFDSFDGSVWFAAGKAKFRVGYYMVPEKEKGISTLNAEDKYQVGSSIYFNASMSF